MKKNSRSAPWEKIFSDYSINNHNFNRSPHIITAQQIKDSVAGFKNTGEKEVRILCKQDSRKDRPQCFIEKGLFILPIKNGIYAIVKGEGYMDIPTINTKQAYQPKLSFSLDTAKVGNSEMQHLDYAYATSLIRSFVKDSSLVLTIRGRKYTPEFSFNVGKNNISVKSVQTEVDAGFEGKNQVVLVEAKKAGTTDTMIRQLYYPFRQWSHHTNKAVINLFFENSGNSYSFWKFKFTDVEDYNSIVLEESAKFIIND